MTNWRVRAFAKMGWVLALLGAYYAAQAFIAHEHLAGIGIALASLGCLFNFTVMKLNGDSMPVHYDDADLPPGRHYEDENTKLRWLGDVLVIDLGKWEKIFSVGDLLIFIGNAVLCLSYVWKWLTELT